MREYEQQQVQLQSLSCWVRFLVVLFATATVSRPAVMMIPSAHQYPILISSQIPVQPQDDRTGSPVGYSRLHTVPFSNADPYGLSATPDFPFHVVSTFARGDSSRQRQNNMAQIGRQGTVTDRRPAPASVSRLGAVLRESHSRRVVQATEWTQTDPLDKIEL